MNKSILKTNTSRRNFLGGTAATVALTAGVGTPWIAQAASNVKIGLIHPATGWAAYPAAQLRYGAQLAIADINAAGGIKSMGGAQLEALLGDSQTKPEIGAAEVEKMNELVFMQFKAAINLQLASPLLLLLLSIIFHSRWMLAFRISLFSADFQMCSVWLMVTGE